MYCDVCGEWMQMVSLGRMPIVGYLERYDQHDAQPLPTFPYNLAYCYKCGAVRYEQNSTATKALQRMNNNYPSTRVFHDEDGMQRKTFCQEIARYAAADSSHCVLDIGCNSGHLMRAISDQLGCRVIGVEPSKVLGDFWEQFGFSSIRPGFTGSLPSGNWIWNGLFDQQVFEHIQDVPFRVIVLSHVLEHIPDANQLLQWISQLMRSDTLLMIEVPYLLETLAGYRFDDLVFEHVHHFTIQSLSARLALQGLGILQLDHLDTGGGSIRVWIRKGIVTQPHITDRLEYAQLLCFVANVDERRREIHALLDQYPAGSVVGYGGKMAQYLVFLFQLQDKLSVIWNDLDLYEHAFVPGTHIQYRKPHTDLSSHDVSAVLNLAPYYTKELRKKVVTLGNFPFIDLFERPFDQREARP